LHKIIIEYTLHWFCYICFKGHGFNWYTGEVK